MYIDKYEDRGRKLLVEFCCQRCKKTVTRSLEECMQTTKDYNNNLYNLPPPKDWQDGGFYYPLFCPDCKKAYEDFMKGK